MPPPAASTPPRPPAGRWRWSCADPAPAQQSPGPREAQQYFQNILYKRTNNFCICTCTAHFLSRALKFLTTNSTPNSELNNEVPHQKVSETTKQKIFSVLRNFLFLNFKVHTIFFLKWIGSSHKVGVFFRVVDILGKGGAGFRGTLVWTRFV